MCHKANMSETVYVFNRHRVQLHRERAARTSDDSDFLFREIGERLCDRLDDVKRAFPTALDLGCRGGLIGNLLNGRGCVETLYESDLSPAMATTSGRMSIVTDEEFLPFQEESFDLILSNLNLHWVNDLPGCLAQIRKALKPDGLFLATMLGGETLRELRQSLMQAELSIEGGVSPRISPFADVRDAGNLLVRAGFTLPVADTETLTVSYSDPLKLMSDLRNMGETNAVQESRKTISRRETLMQAARLYAETFNDDTGRVPATFQVIYLTAWAPSPPAT